MIGVLCLCVWCALWSRPHITSSYRLYTTALKHVLKEQPVGVCGVLGLGFLKKAKLGGFRSLRAVRGL